MTSLEVSAKNIKYERKANCGSVSPNKSQSIFEQGHAEVIQITFDADVVSYEDILIVFMTTHNPTTLNQQGADKGTQYRSVIYYHNDN